MSENFITIDDFELVIYFLVALLAIRKNNE